MIELLVGDKACRRRRREWARTRGAVVAAATFDAVAHAASVEGEAIVLTSPVDPAYGIRVRRKIALHPTKAEMSIETTYEKVQGVPVRIAVWTITQLASPRVMTVALPERSAFAGGFRGCCPHHRRTCQCRAGS